MKYPELRDDLRDFEKAAGISVDVLVRIGNTVAVGRYLHGIGEWQAGWLNNAKVSEWWPLPEARTGNDVSGDLEGVK